MTSGREIDLEELIKQRPVVIDTGCKWILPIYISKNDVLTDETARQILGHNETWERNCEANK